MQEHETPEEQFDDEPRNFITLEDVVVCEGCIKADVCEVLKSVMRLGMYAQQMEADYSVKVQLSASIYECEHRSDGIAVL